MLVLKEIIFGEYEAVAECDIILSIVGCSVGEIDSPSLVAFAPGVDAPTVWKNKDE